MDEFATVDVNQGNPPPEKLQAFGEAVVAADPVVVEEEPAEAEEEVVS